MQATDCVVRLSHYAEYAKNKELKDAVAQVSLAKATIEQSKQLEQNQEEQWNSNFNHGGY